MTFFANCGITSRKEFRHKSTRALQLRKTTEPEFKTKQISTIQHTFQILHHREFATAMSDSTLFKPLTVGKLKLSHRIGMCPLTRYRATDDHIPLPMVVKYYEQRASIPGTLLVSEGTFISPAQGGFANVPGIYNEEQIAAWRKVTDAVHSKGSFIFCQLWALGRTAETDVAKKENITIMSSSNIPVDAAHSVPVPLSLDQIKVTVQDYARAAENAVKAGFDGVELHGANGYLIDQFLQDRCNRRDDKYGGSVENRSRFALEAVKAVVDIIGADRTAIRFSPWSTYNGMRMDDPVPQFKDIILKLNELKLAYLHLVESRIAGNADVETFDKLEFAMDIWSGPLLIAGGYRPTSARQLVDVEHKDKDIVVLFGRYFISTPDLPFRIRENLDLNEYDRSTFYTPMSAKGYTDYTFSKEFLSSVAIHNVA
jgi:NADPH2 dehydrogenase